MLEWFELVLHFRHRPTASMLANPQSYCFVFLTRMLASNTDVLPSWYVSFLPSSRPSSHASNGWIVPDNTCALHVGVDGNVYSHGMTVILKADLGGRSGEWAATKFA
jgi:hypothetical protein